MPDRHTGRVHTSRIRLTRVATRLRGRSWAQALGIVESRHKPLSHHVMDLQAKRQFPWLQLAQALA